MNMTYRYANTAHKHAVTLFSNGSSFAYDANGNMTSRVEVSGTRRITYTQVWSVDNRLVEVVSGTQHTQFFYDAVGTLVKKVDPRGTTAYVGADDEITWLVPTQTITVPASYTHTLYLPMVSLSQINASAGVSTTYYRFNGARVTMRSGSNVYWIHGDHLGSASLTTSFTGTKVSELRYMPYGETRYSSGSTSTDKRFTSQEEQTGIGLYNYGVRFYDPQIGRFISADTIVPAPGNPESLNRFSYALNNALRYVDPTGHCPENDQECIGVYNQVQGQLSFNANYLKADISWDAAKLRDLLGWIVGGHINFTQNNLGGSYWNSSSFDIALTALDKAQTALGPRTDMLLGLGDGLQIVNKSNEDQPVLDYAGNRVGKILGATDTKDRITLFQGGMSVDNILHELGHIVDMNIGGPGANIRGQSYALWSNGSMWQAAHSWGFAASYYGSLTTYEDFAETFAWYVFDKTYASDRTAYNSSNGGWIGITLQPGGNRLGALSSALDVYGCYR